MGKQMCVSSASPGGSAFAARSVARTKRGAQAGARASAAASYTVSHLPASAAAGAGVGMFRMLSSGFEDDPFFS